MRPLVCTCSIFVLALTTGCPGDDGSGDTNPMTDDGTTMAPATSDGSSGDPMDSSGGPDTTTSGPDETTTATDDTTGGAVCGTNVEQSPECDACTHANCCPEVQACFGDETVTEDTDCLLLNNCIATMCAGAGSLMEVEQCVDMSCPELAGAFEVYLAFNGCWTGNCLEECSG